MVRFLFWNLRKKPLASIIADIAEKHRIDIFMFAECAITPAEMLTSLNRHEVRYHSNSPISNCNRITVYTRFSHHFIAPIYERSYLTIRKLQLPGQEEFLLAVVHLPSKQHWKEIDQTLECTTLARTIRDVEERMGHSRTIIAGDFNMNPFEDGMVSSHGLHAVMSQEVARRGSRTIQENKYPFFYNPMWQHFGDRLIDRPLGTYYYAQSVPVCYFWNNFDQVLLRPDILDYFDNESLAILHTVGEQTLLTKKNLPAISDHLPIMFSLNL